MAKDDRPRVILGGYELDDQLRLVHRPIPPTAPGADYGADPVGDGTYRMVPSGDIVDYAERVRRLTK